MKFLLSLLFFIVFSGLQAQYLTLEVGGTGLYCPTLSYDYLVKKTPRLNSNGTRFKAGIGYWDGKNSLGVVKFGLFRVWGKSTTVEAGMEVGLPFGELAFDYNKWLLHPCMNFRFGKGAVRGLLGFGPLLIPNRDGPLFSPLKLLPMGTAGVSLRLFESKQ